MIAESKTDYKENKLLSDIHRTLGKFIWYCDLDGVMCKDGIDMEAVKVEYSGDDEFNAIIDYKYKGKLAILSDKYYFESGAINYNWSALQKQKRLADKLKAYFFQVIYYLEPEQYPRPMFYVIPINQKAKEFFVNRNLQMGQWLSVRQYSKFQHLIRDLKWNKDEINIKGIKLKDLSSEKRMYDLPKIEFDWVK